MRRILSILGAVIGILLVLGVTFAAGWYSGTRTQVNKYKEDITRKVEEIENFKKERDAAIINLGKQKEYLINKMDELKAQNQRLKAEKQKLLDRFKQSTAKTKTQLEKDIYEFLNYIE